MLYLILAILSSAAIAILMRFADRRVQNNMVMFAANYGVCGILSVVFVIVDGGVMALTHVDATAGEFAFAGILGTVGGVLFLVSFMLLQFNIRRNGMVLASTFMKLGVLVPVLMSILLGWDRPSVVQIVGVALAVAAIILINGEGSKESGGKSAGIWLVVLLLVGGFTDSLSNIYDKLGASSLKNHYLLFIFVAAMLVSIVMVFVKRQKFAWKDAFWGMLIGVPNYFSARFLLYALADVPAIVAYPVYNISVILILSLIGFLAFKEKFSPRKLIGLLVIIGAIICCR